ncbi:hypothetical protein ACEWY4_003863 [Coilia grayii]|uniref:Uncharacterized protein n=1 Tax=Coilia grayii TaxID=363190 RepID=A0ABD1KSH2_9TELE
MGTGHTRVHLPPHGNSGHIPPAGTFIMSKPGRSAGHFAIRRQICGGPNRADLLVTLPSDGRSVEVSLSLTEGRSRAGTRKVRSKPGRSAGHFAIRRQICGGPNRADLLVTLPSDGRSVEVSLSLTEGRSRAGTRKVQTGQICWSLCHQTADLWRSVFLSQKADPVQALARSKPGRSAGHFAIRRQICGGPNRADLLVTLPSDGRSVEVQSFSHRRADPVQALARSKPGRSAGHFAIRRQICGGPNRADLLVTLPSDGRSVEVSLSLTEGRSRAGTRKVRSKPGRSAGHFAIRRQICGGPNRADLLVTLPSDGRSVEVSLSLTEGRSRAGTRKVRSKPGRSAGHFAIRRQICGGQSFSHRRQIPGRHSQGPNRADLLVTLPSDGRSVEVSLSLTEGRSRAGTRKVRSKPGRSAGHFAIRRQICGGPNRADLLVTLPSDGRSVEVSLSLTEGRSRAGTRKVRSKPGRSAGHFAIRRQICGGPNRADLLVTLPSDGRSVEVSLSLTEGRSRAGTRKVRSKPGRSAGHFAIRRQICGGPNRADLLVTLPSDGRSVEVSLSLTEGRSRAGTRKVRSKPGRSAGHFAIRRQICGGPNRADLLVTLPSDGRSVEVSLSLTEGRSRAGTRKVRSKPGRSAGHFAIRRQICGGPNRADLLVTLPSDGRSVEVSLSLTEGRSRAGTRKVQTGQICWSLCHQTADLWRSVFLSQKADPVQALARSKPGRSAGHFAIRRQICGGPNRADLLVTLPSDGRSVEVSLSLTEGRSRAGTRKVPDSDVQEMALGTRVADLLRLFAIRRQICGGPIPPRKADRHTGTGRLGLFVLHSGYQVPDSDVQEMALGTRVADLLRLFAIRRQICGGPIPPRKADRHTGTGRCLYNNKGYHSMPTYLNVLNNAILRCRGTDVVIAIFIIVAMSFVPASFVVFLVAEKSTKAKHLQFVSGCDPVIYWLANYIWDMLNYLVPATCCVLILFVFDLPAYTSPKNFPAVLSLFLLYGWSITPIMYPASFWFEVPSTAYVFLIVINLFIGITATVATFLLQLFEHDKDLKLVNSYLKSCFLIFPNYNLGHGLMEMAYNEYINEYYAKIGQFDKVKSPFEWDIVTRGLVAMTIEGFVGFLITILCQYNFLRKPQRTPVSSQPIEDDDVDVACERRRVLRGDADNDMLKIDNLTKVYKSRKMGRILAVDRLCLGVRPGECFGLLGVNGAGKTTTFKMLTGDEATTGGEAFIGGRR